MIFGWPQGPRGPGLRGTQGRPWEPRATGAFGALGGTQGPLGKGAFGAPGGGGTLRGSWGPWERLIEPYSKPVPNAQVASSWAVLRTKNVRNENKQLPKLKIRKNKRRKRLKN